MKIKHGIIVVISIAAAAGILLAGCTTPSPADVEGLPSIMGFNGPLKLVAKYKPLHLYIYADVASTNKHPDYLIFNRNEPLVIADNKSNAVEVIFGEKDFRGQFTTTYDYNGQILKRSYSTENYHSGQTNYLYFDSNGDGEWDFLHMSGTNTESSRSFVRSNLCWVPVGQK
jgi:prepilin-type processing-associated H-X9-DG protein